MRGGPEFKEVTYGGSPIPVELLDRAVWRFLKGKCHLTASASLYTNWRTAIVLSAYSTVTLFARLRGWSTSQPRRTAM